MLALSGGPDSLCLFYLMLQLKKKGLIDFAIAHVDHRWREESRQEAEILETLAKEQGVPFFLKVLDPSKIHGNLEQGCREERLKFFKEIVERISAVGVVMGHHADDQGETVLKWIFEGSSLQALSGMHEETVLMGIKIFRPLLSIRKQEINAWLKKENVRPFEDTTNLDPRFLRGRFRASILPTLANEFGKEIVPSLCHLAKEAEEFSAYVQEKIMPYLERQQRTKTGIFLDLSTVSLSLFEVKEIIRQLAEDAACFLSRDALQQGALHLMAKSGDCQVSSEKGGFLFLDRGRVFLPFSPLPLLPEEKLLLKNGATWGGWEVAIQKVEAFTPSTGWLQAWEGACCAVVPEGSYYLGSSCLKAPFLHASSLSSFWCSHKVPSFLRKPIPVLWQEGKIVHEFLTGKSSRVDDRPLMRVSLLRV